MRKISNKCLFALLITIALSIGSAIQVYAKKLGNMPEVSVPIHIRVDNNQVYIADNQANVHFYSIKGQNLTYQKQIAHRGSGPAESPLIPSLFLCKSYLFLHSIGKCMFFSRNGDYIKEFRVSPGIGSLITPVGGNIVVCKKTPSKKSYIFDFSIGECSTKKTFELRKTIYVGVLNKLGQTGNKISYNPFPSFIFHNVFDNKVFVGDSTRGLYVEIFDVNGKKINQVNLEVERIKVSDEIKSATEDEFKKSQYWGQFNSINQIVFPDYFPAFCRFAVDDGKIYFITYNRKNPLDPKDKSREIIIANWKGKLLKQTFITIDPRGEYDPFYINKGKFYYVVDNVETEEWELHVEDIK